MEMEILGPEMLGSGTPGSARDLYFAILGFEVMEAAEATEAMEVIMAMAGLVSVTAHHLAEVHRHRHR
jgi:hypothetical protein